MVEGQQHGVSAWGSIQACSQSGLKEVTFWNQVFGLSAAPACPSSLARFSQWFPAHGQPRLRFCLVTICMFKSIYSAPLYIFKYSPVNKILMGCYPQLFVTISSPCPTAMSCPSLVPSLSLSAAKMPARAGQAQSALRLWPRWSLLPSDQQSGEIACYLGSIFHALLNCFVLTRCQKWIVTLTQLEPGWGLQARAVGMISLQVEGRILSSWVCRDVLLHFLIMIQMSQ